MSPLLRIGWWLFTIPRLDVGDRATPVLGDIRLVFTDVEMPGSMDGLRLAHAVRKKWPPIAIMLASGKAMVEKDLLPTGALFFTKPYDQLELGKTLTRLVAA